MTDDFVTWLRAQFDEDQWTAEEARLIDGTHDAVVIARHGGPQFRCLDSARMLRDVEAKRRILDLHRPVPMVDGAEGTACASCGPASEEPLAWIWPGHDFTPCDTVKALAAPYADRPGYRQEWSA